MIYTITTNKVNSSNNGLKGFATVVFGDSFKITNIAIMENTETGKLFVSMPRYKAKEKDENNKDVYVDICHPISKEFREQLYGDILAVFNEEKEMNEIPIIEEPEFTVAVSPTMSEDGNILGYARIYFGEDFIVGNVTVMKGQNGPFVSMPSYKTKEVDENNKPVYRDICYPITKEYREKVYSAILETYEMEREKKVQEVSKPKKRREKMQKEMQEQEEKAEAEKKTPKEKKSKGK